MSPVFPSRQVPCPDPLVGRGYQAPIRLSRRWLSEKGAALARHPPKDEVPALHGETRPGGQDRHGRRHAAEGMAPQKKTATCHHVATTPDHAVPVRGELATATDGTRPAGGAGFGPRRGRAPSVPADEHQGLLDQEAVPLRDGADAAGGEAVGGQDAHVVPAAPVHEVGDRQEADVGGVVPLER